MAFSVSKTPMLCSAAASKYGKPLGLRALFSSSTERMLRMSRLLYWNTTGTWSTVSASSARFTLRLLSDSMLVSSAAAWLSATNTTPSTPFRTSLRVAL